MNPVRELKQYGPRVTGMNVAAGPELAAAVTNAGGLGVIGGVGYTPKVLRNQVWPVQFLSRLGSDHEWRIRRSTLSRRT